MEKGKICKERVFLFGFLEVIIKSSIEFLSCKANHKKIKKRLFNITVWLENAVKLCLSCRDQHFGHELGGITGWNNYFDMIFNAACNQVTGVVFECLMNANQTLVQTDPADTVKLLSDSVFICLTTH